MKVNNLFDDFLDNAREHGSAIDNKPVFAREYMRDGAMDMAKRFGVSLEFAEGAIFHCIDTLEGKVKAKRYLQRG